MQIEKHTKYKNTKNKDNNLQFIFNFSNVSIKFKGFKFSFNHHRFTFNFYKIEVITFKHTFTQCCVQIAYELTK